jgi:hypothetical protein
MSENVRLVVKLLDASTAKIVGAGSGDIPKTKAIEELLGKEVQTETSGKIPPDKTGSILGKTSRDGTKAKLVSGAIISISEECIVSDVYDGNTLRITSLEVLPAKKLKVYFLLENRSKRIAYINAAGVKGETFITDDIGDQYDLVSTEKIDNNGRQVPIGGTARFSVLFNAPPESAKGLYLVLRANIGQGVGWATYSFPKINLQ